MNYSHSVPCFPSLLFNPCWPQYDTRELCGWEEKWVFHHHHLQVAHWWDTHLSWIASCRWYREAKVNPKPIVWLAHKMYSW